MRKKVIEIIRQWEDDPCWELADTDDDLSDGERRALQCYEALAKEAWAVELDASLLNNEAGELEERAKRCRRRAEALTRYSLQIHRRLEALKK